MKVRNAEGFLFPASQLDFRHDATLYPSGALHGLGAADPVKVNLPSWGSTYLYLKEAEQSAGLPRYPNLPVQSNGLILRSDLMKAQIAENPSLADNPDVVSVLNELLAAQASMGIVSQAAAPAVQQAAVQAATAITQAQQVADLQTARASADAFQAQQAAEAAAAARKTVSFSLDADAEGTMFLIGKRADGTTYVVSTGAGNIDEYLKRNTNKTRFDLAQTAAYVKAEKADAAVAAAAASTHKAAVDTSTATVQHTDTASGTRSTVNAATGAVTVTTPSGATVTGAGTVQAGGVITTVDTKTGTVTTQNTNTGVTTQTNAATGQTVTAVQTTGTAATGGTFMLPGGSTVTTTTPITGGGLDAGKIALVGLVGLLLLRGAIK